MSAAGHMRYRWLLVLGIMLAIGSAVWMLLPEPPSSVRQGGQTADFKLPDLQGVLQGLPQGEVVLLNFWATWCPPCRKEIPSMAELHYQYASSGLKIVAVSVDQRRDDLVEFVREYNMPFQVLHDADAAVSKRYGVFRYPESFLIDRDGKVRYHLVGAVDWMSDTVTQSIEGVLARPASEARGVRDGDKPPQI